MDHLLVFCGDGIVKDFIGNFSEYRAYVKDYEAEQRAAGEKLKSAKKAETAKPAASEKPRKLGFKEKRELEEIENRLPVLEEEKSQLEAEMCSGKLDYTLLESAGKRIEELKSEIEKLETRWLELQENYSGL